MLFNSFEFLIFLPLVFALYWFVCHKQLQVQNFLLVLASAIFYAWWSPRFLLLLGSSIVLDYLYGFGVASPNRSKAKFFLWLSVVNNLGILALFKYYDFFALQFQAAAAAVGWAVHPVLLQWVLPVGVSFYTFHGMSYVFDIYRGVQKPVRNLVDYSVFVSFFPLLVAGPIERAHHLLPQVQKPRSFNDQQMVQGLRLILWGMFKKVVLADSLAPMVNEIFQRYPEQSGATLFLGMIGFSFQIYCDFSGYTDIALGTAKLFGFELLSNFRFPYFSRNIAEFWRRWHISLSSWFRDYVYIPLGGSKQGKAIAVRNTFVIFLLSGFWHGANWTFLFWGLLHAIGFLPLLLLGKNRSFADGVVAQDRLLPSVQELFQMLFTFLFVSVAWVLFRADSMPQAMAYCSCMITDLVRRPEQLLQLPYGASVMLYIVPLLGIDWYLRHDERNLRVPEFRFLRYTFYFVLLILTLSHLNLLTDTRKIDFIYFQF